MLYLKDKSEDVWSWICNDTDKWMVCYEDETRKPLEFADLIFETGKYKGQTLLSVTDRPYLEWLTTNDNDFVAFCTQRRLAKL